jgi:hypothetical protein
MGGVRKKVTAEPYRDIDFSGAKRGAVLRSALGVAESQTRFPVFEVPASAPIIPASRIQEALDEDDLI